MKRRALVGAVAAAVLLAVVPKRARAAKRIRPPGALPPGNFEHACIGCFRCAEVCPTSCIRFESSWSLEGALPFLELSSRACVLCMTCTQVCPTGALVATEADAAVIAREVHLGTPQLTRASCLSWSGRGVCRLCYLVCPYPEAAVELVGPQKAPLFNAQSCVGCGLCEEACPDGARAITIVPT